MPQTSKASSWGRRPTTAKKEAPKPADLDKFVRGGAQEMARLNVDLPKSLRARVKAGCALEGKEMKDVVRELLEQRFPK